MSDKDISEELQKKFIDAVNSKDLEILKSLSNDHKGIIEVSKNTKGSYGIHIAAAQGFLEGVKFFVEEASVSIELENRQKDTPVIDAAYGNHIEIVKYFIDKGANVNTKNKHGNSSLSWASQEGHFDLAKYLVTIDGIDLNTSDKSGFTPLHKSVNHPAISRLLLEAGADPMARTNTGMTWLIYILDAAPDNLDLDLLDLYCSLEKVDVNVVDTKGYGRSALSIICEAYMNAALTLISLDPSHTSSPSSPVSEVETSLAFYSKLTLYFAKEGQSIPIKNTGYSTTGLTPLHMAASIPLFDLASTLAKSDKGGIDTENKSSAVHKRGITPLAVAKSDSVRRMLIEEGATAKYTATTRSLYWISLLAAFLSLFALQSQILVFPFKYTPIYTNEYDPLVTSLEFTVLDLDLPDEFSVYFVTVLIFTMLFGYPLTLLINTAELSIRFPPIAFLLQIIYFTTLVFVGLVAYAGTFFATSPLFMPLLRSLVNFLDSENDAPSPALRTLTIILYLPFLAYSLRLAIAGHVISSTKIGEVMNFTNRNLADTSQLSIYFSALFSYSEDKFEIAHYTKHLFERHPSYGRSGVVYVFVCKVVVVLTALLLSNNVVPASIIFLLTGLSLLATSLWRPYYRSSVLNAIVTGIYASIVWSNIVGVITALATGQSQVETGPIPFVIFLVVLVLFFMAGWALFTFSPFKLASEAALNVGAVYKNSPDRSMPYLFRRAVSQTLQMDKVRSKPNDPNKDTKEAQEPELEFNAERSLKDTTNLAEGGLAQDTKLL